MPLPLQQGRSSANISKYEQRVLHALAQGGRIQHRPDNPGRNSQVRLLQPCGYGVADRTVALFRKLKRRAVIASQGGGPCGITRQGLDAVRAQADQR